MTANCELGPWGGRVWRLEVVTPIVGKLLTSLNLEILLHVILSIIDRKILNNLFVGILNGTLNECE